MTSFDQLAMCRPKAKIAENKNGGSEKTVVETKLDGLEHIKAWTKAIRDLDMSCLDLNAAESRRRITDMQLEKAKSGTLGVDAAELVVLDLTVPTPER